MTRPAMQPVVLENSAKTAESVKNLRIVDRPRQLEATRSIAAEAPRGDFRFRGVGGLFGLAGGLVGGLLGLVVLRVGSLLRVLGDVGRRLAPRRRGAVAEADDLGRVLGLAVLGVLGVELHGHEPRAADLVREPE